MQRLQYLLIVLFLTCFNLPAFAAIPFKDMPNDHWAIDSVNKMVELGFISGFPDGTFKGTKMVNRYEISLYLSKVVSYIDNRMIQQKKGVVLSEDDYKDIKQQANEIKLLKEELSQLKTDFAKIKKNNEK